MDVVARVEDRKRACVAAKNNNNAARGHRLFGCWPEFQKVRDAECVGEKSSSSIIIMRGEAKLSAGLVEPLGFGHVTLVSPRAGHTHPAVLPRPGTTAVGLGAGRRPLGVALAPGRFSFLGQIQANHSKRVGPVLLTLGPCERSHTEYNTYLYVITERSSGCMRRILNNLTYELKDKVLLLLVVFSP